jgi:hypothetical protein
MVYLSDRCPGIGNTISRSLKKTGSRDDRAASRSSLDDSSVLSSPNRASQKLPPGTGPGTSGKPGMDHDLERALSDRSAAGFGTDAAAATGGSLSSTHQAAMTGLGESRILVSSWPPLTSQSIPQTDLSRCPGLCWRRPPHQDFPPPLRPLVKQSESLQAMQVVSDSAALIRLRLTLCVVLDAHATGHSKRDVMPTGATIEDTKQLQRMLPSDIDACTLLTHPSRHPRICSPPRD